MTLAIVDYGMGNIRSITTTLKYLGVTDIVLTSEGEALANADKILLPGVGSFGKAIKQIREKKLDIVLNKLVLEDKKPILGICLGMQLMGNGSDEDGQNKGLGLINGNVTKFENNSLKIPHVGFNQVKINGNTKLYQGFKDNADFYFTHSYRMLSDSHINPSFCEYGGDFVASFELNNIAGTQYHPELSQYNGLKVFKNFLENF